MDAAKQLIENRRSLRALAPLDAGMSAETLAVELTQAARLAPSNVNSQPWRFVSVYKDPQLQDLRDALAPRNQWARACSLFIVVCAAPANSLTGPSKSGHGGAISYYLYDTGIASAFLMLRAADFGLVAHPIAGFDEAQVAKAIGLSRSLDADLQIVALIAVGPKATDATVAAALPSDLRTAETTRPERRPLEELAFHNEFPVSRDAASGAAAPAPEKLNFERDLILVNDDGKIYHFDQATLQAMTSIDEMTVEDRVAYGFIEELVKMGISVAAIPNMPEMNAAIFCYLINLGSLKPPTKDASDTAGDGHAATDAAGDTAAAAPVETTKKKPVSHRKPNLQYTAF